MDKYNATGQMIKFYTIAGISIMVMWALSFVFFGLSILIWMFK